MPTPNPRRTRNATPPAARSASPAAPAKRSVSPARAKRAAKPLNLAAWQRKSLTQASALASALVLPPQYSQRILYASSLMTASIVSAVYNDCPDNAFLAALVLFSSINYWRHPVLGLRRHFDMVCAIGSLGYQCVYTSQYTSPTARHLYWGTVLAGGSCYLIGRHFTFKYRAFNVSSALHVCLHVFGNLGNLLLYDSLGMNKLHLRDD